MKEGGLLKTQKNKGEFFKITIQQIYKNKTK